MLSDSFMEDIFDCIKTSLDAYGGFDNLFSAEAPSVSIPISCLFRIASLVALLDSNTVSDSILEIFHKMKDCLKKRLHKAIHEKSRKEPYDIFNSLDDTSVNEVITEEAGFMNMHIIIHTSEKVALPTNAIHLPKPSNKRERKRFRGHAPTDLQGGCPRKNLETHIKASIKEKLKTVDKNEIENLNIFLLDRQPLIQTIESLSKKESIKRMLREWIQSDASRLNASKGNLEIHVASWRKPVYIKGRYTKAKRNVSQTPFYVPIDKSEESYGDTRMKRLGTTSVEEEICPLVAKISCGGISSANNEHPNENTKSNTLFGMAKFHASGREDMDVRMVLPLNVLQDEKSMSTQTKQQPSALHASGRPFVLEINDALSVPTMESLQKTVLAINCVSHYDDIVSIGESVEDNGWIKEYGRKFVQYGRNEKGVGVSGLEITGSKSYSGLQSETEDKVKFYGCLCWSKNKIPSQDYLEEKLCQHGSIYPIEIAQLTPLRVLHRRSAATRIRHVLSMKAIRLDDHWFRLSLSTSAGTYVKEFCHGDCGRTKPSISSLLGCTVDIVELDCEGIATS
jgi:tRNA pseudouridine synthase 10